MSGTLPPVDDVLRGLKDFQRSTVDYVFDRLYAPGSSGRFLVADEVGLGKTLVARGVIAKAIEHLRAENIPRIDIVYICSNADIAKQNINRLKVGSGEHVALASRLTLLPQEIPRLKASKSGVNFISFTPQTSFDLKSGLGQADERVLLYQLLRGAWDFGSGKAPQNVFQGYSGAESFRARIDRFDPTSIDAEWRDRDFFQALNSSVARDRTAGRPDLRSRFESLCSAYARADSLISDETSRERYSFIGELRAVLGASCVEALEPDLIILDEFQRFGHLLNGEDDASRLARAVFEYPKVRVLLLSATPYKMYTLADDAGGEDHYADFLKTLRFLERAKPTDTSAARIVNAYREGMVDLGESGAAGTLEPARRALEERLRTVMVRTERLAATPDRNGMLVEVPVRPMRIEPNDLLEYLAVQRVAREVEADDAMELWKSAPYVLNFADDGYKLGRKVREAVNDTEARVRLAKVLSPTPNATIEWAKAERYAPLEPGNARFRALFSDVVESGAWRLLWVPPSLPYYRLAGPFADAPSFTKRLVFSSWRLVPRAISALMSYEVERRMLEGDPTAVNTPEARKKRRGLLRFAVADGRLTGMPVLALLYPSSFLARTGDPALLLAERARENSAHDGPPSVDSVSLEHVLAIARDRISVSLERLGEAPAEGVVDERWYWAAPLLLDRALDPKATQAWFDQPDLAAAWSGEKDADSGEAESADDESDRHASAPPRAESDDAGWKSHVEQACRVARSGTGASLGVLDPPLGRMPEDLVDVLAELAVAGPAVAMFRALDRVVGGEAGLTHDARVVLRNGAGRTAWSFRALFNQPEIVSMLRGGARGLTETPYWRQVLRYCAEGCLPAVLDEYVHVLRDHLGLLTGSVGERVHEVADEMRDAVELRVSRVGIEELALSASGRTVRSAQRNLRTHFALRFGDESNEEGSEKTRADQVRKAFNSPFWPFVLATTSVGQEGLDFHTYCHAVVHWNLPSNPVDLEQREGRVHRYKGHAVRKNVARAHGWSSLESAAKDPWEDMFERAAQGREPGATDIVPYWVYATEGGARIERHILSLPLSREHAHAARLRSSLAVYRMVFGQPRQEDLLGYLVDRCPSGGLEAMATASRIDLSPR